MFLSMARSTGENPIEALSSVASTSARSSRRLDAFCGRSILATFAQIDCLGAVVLSPLGELVPSSADLCADGSVAASCDRVEYSLIASTVVVVFPVGIGKAQFRQNARFQTFHDLRFLIRHVIVAEQMKEAMHQ